MIVVVYKDIAARNAGFCKMFERIVKQTFGYALAPILNGNSKMLDRACATIVATQDGTDDIADRVGSNGAETRVSVKERRDGSGCVRFIQAKTFNPEPKVNRRLIILECEGSDQHLGR